MTTDHDTLLTIAEAAKFAGVSTRTVRRWLDQGHIPDERKVKDKRTPVVISQRHLVSYLAARGVTPDKGHVKGQVTSATSQGELEALKGQVATLDKMIEELRTDKRRLVDELERERERNRALTEQVMSLVRENRSLGGHGRGIAGYIADGLRKLVNR